MKYFILFVIIWIGFTGSCTSNNVEVISSNGKWTKSCTYKKYDNTSKGYIYSKIYVENDGKISIDNLSNIQKQELIIDKIDLRTISIKNNQLIFLVGKKFANADQKKIKIEGTDYVLYSLDMAPEDNIYNLDFALKVKIDDIDGSVHQKEALKKAIKDSWLKTTINSSKEYSDRGYKKTGKNEQDDIYYYLYRFKLVEREDNKFTLVYSGLEESKDELTFELKTVDTINDIKQVLNTDKWLDNCQKKMDNVFTCTVKEPCYSYINITQNINYLDMMVKKHLNYLYYKAVSDGKKIIISSRKIKIEPNNACNFVQSDKLLNKLKLSTEPQDLDFSTFEQLMKIKQQSEPNSKSKTDLSQLNKYGQQFDKLYLDNDDTLVLKLKKSSQIIYIKFDTEIIKKNKTGVTNAELTNYLNSFKNFPLKYNKKELSLIKDSLIRILDSYDCIDIDQISSDYFKVISDNGEYYVIPKPKEIEVVIDAPDLLEIKDIFSSTEWLGACEPVQGKDKTYKCPIQIEYDKVLEQAGKNRHGNYFILQYSDNKLTIKARRLVIPKDQYCDLDNSNKIKLFNVDFELGNPNELRLDMYQKLIDEVNIKSELNNYDRKYKSLDIDTSHNEWLVLNSEASQDTIDIKLKEGVSDEQFNGAIFVYNNVEFKDKKIIVPQCEKFHKDSLTSKDQHGNRLDYFYEYNQSDNSIIVEPMYETRSFTITYYYKRFGKELDSSYPLPANIKYKLPNNIDITPSSGTEKPIEITIHRDIDSNPERKTYYDTNFFPKITPADSLQYLGRDRNIVKYLIKEPKKILVVYYPVSYTTSYRSLFSSDEQDELTLLGNRLTEFLNNINSKYEEVYVRLSNEILVQYKGEIDIKKYISLSEQAVRNDHQFEWWGSTINEDFYYPVSYESHVLFFSRFTSDDEIKRKFKDSYISKIYLINFIIINDINTISTDKIKVKNVVIANRASFKGIIDIDDIKGFFFPSDSTRTSHSE